MPKYRKKPLTLDAVQWQKLGDHPEVKALPHRADWAFINTLEGSLTVKPGTWIVGPGAAGEFWPVKDEIFQQTYEKVEDFETVGYLPVERMDPKDSQTPFVIKEGRVVATSTKTNARFGDKLHGTWTRTDLIKAANKYEKELEVHEVEEHVAIESFMRFLDINRTIDECSL